MLHNNFPREIYISNNPGLHMLSSYKLQLVILSSPKLTYTSAHIYPWKPLYSETDLTTAELYLQKMKNYIHTC